MKRLPEIILAAACLFIASAFAWAQPATQPAAVKPAVVVGVWAQPIGMMQTWKDRGINTLVGEELEGGARTQKQWEDAAEALGLFYVTSPDLARLAEQAAQPHRLAFSQRDEPDLNRWKDAEPANSPNNVTLIPAGRYKGWRQPSVLADVYAKCKAAAPTIPVFCNFSGQSVTPAAYDHGDGHDPYFPSIDWACQDWHYLNVDAVAHSIQRQRDAIRRLSLWSANGASIVPNGVADVTGVAATPGSKFRLSYVEASDQNLSNANGRGPTPDEYELQVRTAMKAGCTGYVHFAHRFGMSPPWPAGFDGAVLIPGLVDRMKRLSAEYNPPPPIPGVTLEQRVAELEAWRAKVTAVSTTQPAR